MFNMFLDDIRTAVTSVSLAKKLKHGAKRPLCPKDSQTLGLVTVAVLSAIMSFEITQLVCVLVGAAGYLMLQMLQPTLKQPLPKKVVDVTSECSNARRIRPKDLILANWKVDNRNPRNTAPRAAGAAPSSEVRTRSVAPITKPVFQGTGWTAEVTELLDQITPTTRCDAVVQNITCLVKHTIQSLFPEAEVVGFANGNLTSGKAFGVAVPEVDIVVNVSPMIMQRRLPRNNFRSHANDHKLLKSAIRACTDRLVASGNFKFRRSAFRGDEPKVVLVVPASLGIFSESVALNFTINSVVPFYNAALMKECGQMETRALGLIMLVKRWAKDRGLCHAAKGHLSPYLWTLFAIYFLQVDASDEGALLPPLEAFAMTSSLASKHASPKRRQAQTPVDAGSKRTVGELFKAFMEFYARQFNWRNEAVSVRCGFRAPPNISLPLHIMLHADGVTSEVGPSIEDPFENRNNLGSCMTAASFAHLREELQRADNLCSSGESLAKLLEPWVPAGCENSEQGVADNCDEELLQSKSD